MQADAVLEGPSDAELISSVRAGDTGAYGELFARHVDAARRLARSLLPGSDADDLVSEAFAKVLVVLQRGDGPDLALRPYLLTAVRRLHIDKVRADKKLQTTDDFEPFDQGTPFHDTAVEGFESATAAKAFGSLPERWQMVLWHTEVEGMSPQEIAPLIGMKPNSVAALAYRAREGLRQAFISFHAQDADDEACEWTQDNIGAYIRASTSRRDSAKVEAHLEDCRRCMGIYLELTEVNANLRGVLAPIVLGGAAAAYLKGGALAGAAGGGASGAVSWLQNLVRQPAGAAAGVAVAVAVAAGAFTLFTGGGDDPAPPESADVAPPAPPAPAVGDGGGGAGGGASGGGDADPEPAAIVPSAATPTPAPVDPTPSAQPTQEPAREQTSESPPAEPTTRPPTPVDRAVTASSVETAPGDFEVTVRVSMTQRAASAPGKVSVTGPLTSAACPSGTCELEGSGPWSYRFAATGLTQQQRATITVKTGPDFRETDTSNDTVTLLLDPAVADLGVSATATETAVPGVYAVTARVEAVSGDYEGTGHLLFDAHSALTIPAPAGCLDGRPGRCTFTGAGPHEFHFLVTNLLPDPGGAPALVTFTVSPGVDHIDPVAGNDTASVPIPWFVEPPLPVADLHIADLDVSDPVGGAYTVTVLVDLTGDYPGTGAVLDVQGLAPEQGPGGCARTIDVDSCALDGDGPWTLTYTLAPRQPNTDVTFVVTTPDTYVDPNHDNNERGIRIGVPPGHQDRAFPSTPDP